ncbi:MAG: MFS transporter [Planctomycetia bacterium]|nr:MFS transporter [Planctomycetia bacterium]
MNRELSPPVLDQAPSRVRYGVLFFVCTLAMITYLDRVCFAQAGDDIRSELGLHSPGDLGLAFTAFALSYAIFEIPTGWLGDVFGPRSTLIRIVLWWSLFTGLTGMIGLSFLGPVGFQFWLLVVIRFLFGIGEAGAFPNITRALHNWLPFTERGLGQGAVWMSGRLAGGLTPLIWGLLIVQAGLHWRDAFWVFAALGIAWCVGFALWFRNTPAEKESVNEAERALIAQGRTDEGHAHANVPWGRLLSSTNLWALCLMYFCAAYGWYFNITYLPTFLEQQFGIDKKDLLGSVYKGGPLWMGAIACLVGGLATDWFIRRTGNRKWGRRLFGVVGHSVCAVCYLACLFAPTAFTFFLAISMAAFWNDLTMGSAWSVCQDIGKRYAAIVAGAMNTIGNLGGAAAGFITGRILNSHLDAYAAAQGVAVKDLSPEAAAGALLPGYHINFLVFALVYVVAVLFWLRVDATEPVVPDTTEPPAEGAAAH